MSSECAILMSWSKDKRWRSKCIECWKWFLLHNWFPFTPIIMKLHKRTPYEMRMCPVDFGVKRWKVKVTLHFFLEMVFCFPFYSLHHETSHKDSPWVQDVPCGFFYHKVKGQGHNALIPENSFLPIIAFPLLLNILKLHTQTLHEFRMCPIDVRVKRSHVKVTMHWLLEMVFGT